MQNRIDRKKQLIAEGALYRAEVMLAKETVEASLRPDSIAKSALHQVALIGFAVLKGRNFGGLPGLNLQTVLPLALSGFSALSKNRPLLKTVLRGAVVAGGIAGLVRWIIRRKRKSTVETGNSYEI